MTSLSPVSGAHGPVVRPEPLREAVYLRIAERISSGHYPPGAALTEAGLSRELQVSRTPVREALLRLQAEGVVGSALARGFTVRPLATRDAAELYPILAALERLAVQTAGRLDRATLDGLDGTLTELEGCAEPVRRWQLDTRWHAGITAAAGNEHLQQMIRQLRTNLSRYELAYMREVRSRIQADQQHRAITDALAAGEPDRAADLVAEHWHEGMQLVLDWLNDRR